MLNYCLSTKVTRKHGNLGTFGPHLLNNIPKAKFAIIIYCLSKETNEKQKKFGTKGHHLLNNKLKRQFSITITLFISDNKTQIHFP